MESTKHADSVRLPSEMRYLGHFPEFSAFDVYVKCKFCNFNLIPQALKKHLEKCPANINPEYRYQYKRSASMVDGIDQTALNNSLLSKYSCLDVKPPCLNPHIDLGGRVLNGLVEAKSSASALLPPKSLASGLLGGTCPEQSNELSTTSNKSGISISTINTSTQSEIDTSSSNSSPIWESDKNNVYDSCLSSSSSSSVNIVRLKQEKPKVKNNVIPIPFLLSGKKLAKNIQGSSLVKQDLSSQHSTLSQKLVSTPLPSKVLSVDNNSRVPDSYSTPDTIFECRPFFEAVQPSTSVQESSETGKSKLSIIIRRVPNQNSNDARRIALEKENSSRTDNLRCFLVNDESNRSQTVKTAKHPIKRKICDNQETRGNQIDKRNEHLSASEQQIAILTRRIETLNRQIESLRGHVGPLRLENEEYKAEIRNLRCRVEELETSTNALIEQKNLRAKNDKKIEELKQSWERERFIFTQHLEELQTELSDYKNTSSLEKQKLNIVNAFLERRFGLQEALTDNILKEKEILERHIPPTIHYQLVMNELVDIQRSRSLIYTLLNGGIDCHLNNPANISFPNMTVEQNPCDSRQSEDVNSYHPVGSSTSEINQGNSRQVINVFNLSDNKLQYQAYSNEVTSKEDQLDLKEEDGSSNTS